MERRAAASERRMNAANGTHNGEHEGAFPSARHLATQQTAAHDTAIWAAEMENIMAPAKIKIKTKPDRVHIAPGSAFMAALVESRFIFHFFVGRKQRICARPCRQWKNARRGVLFPLYKEGMAYPPGVVNIRGRRPRGSKKLHN
jgi:hypothetical protein